MSADRSRASVGAVRVTLLWIGVTEISHLIIPGLDMKCRGSVSEDNHI